MALNVTRANRIFEKAFAHSPSPPVLRKADHVEQRVNEYGEKFIWALDKGDHQADRVYVTLNAAIADVLELFWEDWNQQRSWEKLTAAELEELRTIPSNVARHL